MTLPVFDFETSSFTGENVVLEQDIFNQVVRRDLIHRVLLFNKMYNRQTFKWVKSKGDVSGSNRKPFRQKKTGRAPQGDIRAPNLYHGGKAHGARPRKYYFPLNKKIRLFGLQSALTSKFLENKIIVINSERLETPTENTINKGLRFLKENTGLIITSTEACPAFSKFIKRFHFASHMQSGKLNVENVMSNRYIIFTKDGLNELIQTLKERHFNYYRNKKIVADPLHARKALITDQFKFDFDPEKKLIIHTPALQGSLEEIESHYRDPQKKIQEILENREKAKMEAEKAKEEKKQKEVESLYADNTAVEKRRAQLKRERRLKVQKEMRRLTIKKKKQQEGTVKKQQDQASSKNKK